MIGREYYPRASAVSTTTKSYWVSCEGSIMRTYKLKLNISSGLETLNAQSASVWNECLKLKEMWDYTHGYSYTCKACELWMDKQLSKTQHLHSQSRQAVRERYFKSWEAFFALRKNGDAKAKPPHREKKYQTTTWKKSAIRVKDGVLILSNGKDNQPLEIPIPDKVDISNIATISLIYDNGQYELHFTYKVDKPTPSESDGVCGVDIGEIHPIVRHDGVNTTIFNGRYIRSIYRLRNKVIASFDTRIDRCKKHSKQWWHVMRRKWKRIRTLDNQIRDGLHKHTTTFVNMCVDDGIGTTAIGNLTNIRDNIGYGKRANQKLHQWAFSKIINLKTYKAKAKGIDVKLIDESYTSQTYPQCLNRKKPTTRGYAGNCGFKYHRDGVGAINISKKYLDRFTDPVVASMATPVGIRLETPTLPELDSGISLKEKKEPPPFRAESMSAK